MPLGNTPSSAESVRCAAGLKFGFGPRQMAIFAPPGVVELGECELLEKQSWEILFLYGKILDVPSIDAQDSSSFSHPAWSTS